MKKNNQKEIFDKKKKKNSEKNSPAKIIKLRKNVTDRQTHTSPLYIDHHDYRHHHRHGHHLRSGADD